MNSIGHKNCRKCGDTFTPKQWRLTKSDFLCPVCARIARNANAKLRKDGRSARDAAAKAREEEDFFLIHADNIIPEPNTGCWLWMGGSAHGYGRARYRGKYWRAHRAAYEQENGPGTANGWIVRHTCDMRACVNPKHLIIGTFADNTEDMIRRKRQNNAVGSKHGNAKLTESSVTEIRRLHANDVDHKEIAQRFGISRRHVRHVVNRVVWRHI